MQLKIHETPTNSWLKIVLIKSFYIHVNSYDQELQLYIRVLKRYSYNTDPSRILLLCDIKLHVSVLKFNIKTAYQAMRCPF